ncbi:MAG TPA: PKD domain-containing protein [Ktedonobacteraceae bacterium]|nr:PKD domain-containing protein [Ktedonobacteraceae bacterium]
MQGSVVYPNVPPTQQTRQSMPGHVLNRLVYFILPVVLVVLVGASMFWLQWASQRGIALGYPTPHVSMFTSVNNNTVQVRNAIQFTADSLGRGLTYSWDFGDNTFGNGLAVSHSYQSGGSYTVTVTVTDVINQSSTARQTVTVTVPGPQAMFTAQNNGGGYYMFDASGSSADPSTSISTYSWDFGDQQTDQNGSSQESHYYYYYGTYTVTLVVTDALGQSSSQYTQTITV